MVIINSRTICLISLIIEIGKIAKIRNKKESLCQLIKNSGKIK